MFDHGENVVIPDKYAVSTNQYPVSRFNQLQVVFYGSGWMDHKNIFLKAISRNSLELHKV